MNQNQLGLEQDEAEKAQLGLGMLRSLMNMDADQVQHDTIEAYQDGNMKLWQKRSQLEQAGIRKPKGKGKEKMGHTVRIDSPEYNFGYLAAAVLGAAALFCGAGLGAAWLLKGNTPPAASSPPAYTDTDTRSTLRPYKGPE